MTMDDESSIYVGGLSFDTTEDALRDKFEEFGSIVAVKIIIDKDTGNSRGYGFVTFTSPRAATKAISNMDGMSLEGRIIRVNEVTAKNGNRYGRDNGRFNTFRERGRGRDNRDFRPRDRSGNSRQFSPARNRRLSPGAYHDKGRLPAHRRSRSPQGGHSPSRSVSPVGRPDNRSSGSPSPRGSERLQNTDTSTKMHTKLSKKAVKEREEELSKIKDELEKANQRRDELRIRLVSLEEENALKEQQITELRIKSQKLEESLSVAISATSQKQNQLMKFQRAFLQVRSCTENLRSSEKELQVMIDSAAVEANIGGSSELHEKRGGKPGLESEDVEWREDDDAGPVNIDD